MHTNAVWETQTHTRTLMQVNLYFVNQGGKSKQATLDGGKTVHHMHACMHACKRIAKQADRKKKAET